MEDVCICYGHIKKKAKNVLIVFPILQTHVVRASQLISKVDAPHILIVESHTQGTLHSQLRTIFLASVDCRVLLRISECQSNVDHLIVLPRCGYQVPALTKGRLTAIALLHFLTNLSRVLFPIRTNSTTGICAFLKESRRDSQK